MVTRYILDTHSNSNNNYKLGGGTVPDDDGNDVDDENDDNNDYMKMRAAIMILNKPVVVIKKDHIANDNQPVVLPSLQGVERRERRTSSLTLLYYNKMNIFTKSM